MRALWGQRRAGRIRRLPLSGESRSSASPGRAKHQYCSLGWRGPTSAAHDAASGGPSNSPSALNEQHCARHAFLFAALLAVAIGVCGCGKGEKGPGAKAEAETVGAAPVSVIVARRDAIREELELTGTCEAYDEVDVVPEAGGKVVRVAADIGDHVNAGDVLVQLDTALVSKQRVQAEKGVESARARLDQAVQGAELTDRQTIINIRQAEQGVAAACEQLRKAEEAYKLTAEQTESRIEQAKVGLASAQAQERDVAAGARSQEIAQAEAAVRQAESDLSLKKTNYERYRRLYEQGAVAEATLDGFRTQYEVAQQSLSQARDALSLAREGARLEQRRLASLGVEQAREQLRLAEAGRRQVKIAARDVESARVGVCQAEENLRLAHATRRRYDVSVADVKAARAGVGQAAAGRDLARTSENKYTIYAPISGLVARRNVDIGEGASPGMPVMRIVNSDPIKVNCQVSELDIDKVKLGDEGEATIDGLPGKTFVGCVADITPQAIEDQRNYIVRVEIDNPDGGIKAGMFARVRLTISEKTDVIVLSRDCLVERGAERWAYIVEKGVVKVRKVKTGITNGRQVEIISGVSAGQQLVSSGQSMLAEGQKVKPVAAKPDRRQGTSGTSKKAKASEAGAASEGSKRKRSR